MLYTNGSKGNVVRQIQTKVGAQVTGVWTTATYRKVYEYQRANGLHQTGEVDEETYNHMFPAPKPAKKAPAPKVDVVEDSSKKVATTTKKTDNGDK